MKKRMLALILALTMLMLTGCSDSEKNETNEENMASTLCIVAMPGYYFDEDDESLEKVLNAALPELSTDTEKITVEYIVASDSESDPYGTMAAMTQISVRMASHEIDLLLCDEDWARRFGDGGETYVPLAELFTEEEQAELGMTPASVALVDDEGNVTDTLSAPCGVDLSASDELRHMLVTEDGIGAYVIAGTENVEKARSVIRYLVGLN